MQCIFCRTATLGTEPREHILPESLGNTDHVLRRGLVCGACNNYFSSKVEKPFLELPEIIAMRFEQKLLSKKGRVPRLPGLLLGSNLSVEIMRDPANVHDLSVVVEDDAIKALLREGSGRIIFPLPAAPRRGPILSRFLAKVALEGLAFRIQEDENFLGELTADGQLEPLRRHARYGEIGDWPVSVRWAYHPDAVWASEDGCPCQIVHEFDYLWTESGELFFVLALFGQELVINMGGPSLDRWHEWLSINNDRSPLAGPRRSGPSTR
jgi:hypothetical protein